MWVSTCLSYPAVLAIQAISFGEYIVTGNIKINNYCFSPKIKFKKINWNFQEKKTKILKKKKVFFEIFEFSFQVYSFLLYFKNIVF